MLKKIKYIVFLILTTYSLGYSQSQDREQHAKKIFRLMSLQGVDTKQNLLYGYFFLDKKKENLEKLEKDLNKQGYKTARFEKIKKEQLFILHCEKIETHSVETLLKREKELSIFAQKYNVDSYDGWDVGNIDPKKPITTLEKFGEYIKTKEKEELFDIGIELYDEELYKYALIVFDECIQHGIKKDTSYYKLANCLINLQQIDLGIAQLEKLIELNPSYYSAYFNLGATCYDNNQYEMSLKYYKKAVELNPKDSRAIYGIAAAQFVLGDKTASKINCENALKIDPKNENALILKKMLENK